MAVDANVDGDGVVGNDPQPLEAFVRSEEIFWQARFFRKCKKICHNFFSERISWSVRESKNLAIVVILVDVVVVAVSVVVVIVVVVVVIVTVYFDACN